MGEVRKILAHVTWSAFVVSACMGSVFPAIAQQAPTQKESSASTNVAQRSQDAELPDSPGAILAQAQTPTNPPPNQSSTSSQAPPQNQSSPTQPPQKPVGTAAAEAPSTSGVAASQPAGVAIAPAKQRRARTIIIRTGAIIGAAVGIGVVVGLTEATSSKPPGAH
jgi:hypothetical protein